MSTSRRKQTHPKSFKGDAVRCHSEVKFRTGTKKRLVLKVTDRVELILQISASESCLSMDDDKSRHKRH